MLPELEKDPRGGSLSGAERLCLFLCHCGANNLQKVTGRLAGVDKSTVSRVVRQVAQLLCSKSREFIKMPDDNELKELAKENKRRFGGLPDCVLGVDGTMLILSDRPQEEELAGGHVVQNFWTRKQDWALCMQLVGDSHMRIRDVDISWPGGTHDARVWNNSLAKTIMESQSKYYIAADSGKQFN